MSAIVTSPDKNNATMPTVLGHPPDLAESRTVMIASTNPMPGAMKSRSDRIARSLMTIEIS
jgi:hypothetical protein